MQLYLIRHAQSVNNALPEAQRVEDPSLTDLGYQQAGYLAEWATSLELTHLVSSPFLRALETTASLAKKTGLAAEVRVDLHELGGCMSGSSPETMVGKPGMTGSEIKARFPTFDVADGIGDQGWWKSKPYETRDLAAQRAHRLLQWTREELDLKNDRVAYVSHGDFTRLLLNCFHDKPMATPWNVSATRIEITPDQTRLDEFNLIQHLPADLLTV